MIVLLRVVMFDNYYVQVAATLIMAINGASLCSSSLHLRQQLIPAELSAVGLEIEVTVANVLA